MSPVAVSDQPVESGRSVARGPNAISTEPPRPEGDWPAQQQAQSRWAATPIRQRLLILRRARHELARIGSELVDALPTAARTRADSYGAEVLTLLDACRFLEREAASILKPRRLGRVGLPLWLAGLESAVHRVPFGTILIIGPANYPLFIPGVQALQALAAGNAVVWKPGRNGRRVALRFAAALAVAGLPKDLLRVTDESAAAGLREIAGADKIFFTGSSRVGREILQVAAQTNTPVVAELSGCDAVIALPSADPVRLTAALKFAIALNGSATCMAPRRLIVIGDQAALIERLRVEFAAMPRIPNGDPEPLRRLLALAARDGAVIHGAPEGAPILILEATPRMAITQADVFAPVLTVLQIDSASEVGALDALCPFGLTAAVFGDEAEARALAPQLNVGTVLINDLIVSTADPRVPFGGRRGSGFGVTRGREGLLEMTAIKTIAARTWKSTLHYQPTTGPAHESFFRGIVAVTHGGTLRERWLGLKQILSAARHLR